MKLSWGLFGVALLIALAWSGSFASPHAKRVPSTTAQVQQACPPDAWEAFDSLKLELPVPHGQTWKAKCVSVEVESMAGELPATQFTVESRTKYGVWYVFEWEVLRDV